jgi:nitronate monooxygenase
MSEPGTPFETAVTRLLGCRHPILSAGMGGPSRAELVAAVSAAGGFGLLGMVNEKAEVVEGQIAAVRAATDRPFGVNLIPFRTERQLLEAEIDVCLRAQVKAMCFFWDVLPDVVKRVKDAGVLVIYQVGSVEEGLEAERAGADIVIAQGVEAGGHVRGRVGIMTLLPEMVRRLRVPVVATGGIATGGGLIAALALGAAGIQCGTLFIATHESFAHDYHKQRIIDAQPGDTVHTDLFALNWPAGSPVRVLANSVTREAAGHLFGNHPLELPREVIAQDDDGPIYKYFTLSPLRNITGDLEKMPLFAGESSALVHRCVPAGEVVERLVDEALQARARIAG